MVGQLHCPGHFISTVNLRIPFGRGLDGAQSCFGRFGEEKNLSMRKSNVNCAICSEVTVPIEPAKSVWSILVGVTNAVSSVRDYA